MTSNLQVVEVEEAAAAVCDCAGEGSMSSG